MKIKWDKSEDKRRVGLYILRIKEIPLKDIYTYFDRKNLERLEVIDEIKMSMKNGKKIPPIILEKRRKKWHIFDGNHRYYAALDLLGENGKVMGLYLSER